MDITKFCASGDIRHYLNKPMRYDGYIYATNGHIAVRIADDPSIEADPISEQLSKKLPAMLDEDAADRTWHKVPEVDTRAAKRCRTCDGAGRVVDCASCDGVGEFEHYGHEYHCKECDGMGQIPVQDDSAGVQCFDCNGSGIHLDSSVEFNGVHIAARYIHLIGSEIPCAEIGISNNPNGIQIFRAPGIVGVVMPVRV